MPWLYSLHGLERPMTPACPSCHASLEDGAQVCPSCGHSLSIPPPRPRGSEESRRDERFVVPTDVRLRKLDSHGVPQKEERTIAHDLSRSGMRVLTSWSDLQEGDKVSIEEMGGTFATGAIVRHVKRGTDQITRAGVEFIGKEAPERLVGTTASLPRPAFTTVLSSPGSSGSPSDSLPRRPESATGRSGGFRLFTTSGPSSSMPRPDFVKPAVVSAPPRVEQAPPAVTPAPVARPIEGVLEEIEKARATARELVGESKIWEALDCLAKARALAEGTPEERPLRILTWETQAKLPSLMRQAHQNLEELASAEPADVAVHSALGRLYREAGLSARSRMAFKRVLTLDPQNREAAAALQALGDPAKPR